MFRNRGTFSKPNISNKGYSAPHYSNYWRRYYPIIVYDRKFVAIEMVMFLILAITACIALFYSYKMKFTDQIADLKGAFLTFQLICLLASAGLLIIFSFMSKNKENLIRNILFIIVISILALLIQLGIKSYLDSKYNEQEFSNMYEQYEASSENDNKRVIGLFTGIKTVKEAYIQDNTNSYLNFKVKTVTYIVIYTLEILVMIYLVYRLKKNEDQKDKLEKDDEILYDNEENVKM